MNEGPRVEEKDCTSAEKTFRNDCKVFLCLWMTSIQQSPTAVLVPFLITFFPPMISVSRTYAAVQRRGPTHKRLGFRFAGPDRELGVPDELMVC